jgi:hypothetical protein
MHHTYTTMLAKFYPCKKRVLLDLCGEILTLQERPLWENLIIARGASVEIP